MLERTKKRWATLDEIGLEELCDRIGQGESLREIAYMYEMPYSTLWRWFQQSEAHRQALQSAIEVDAHGMVEDLLKIADESNDARLRYDARKWLVSKKLWRIYGEKAQHEISGPDGGPIPTSLIIKFREPSQ